MIHHWSLKPAISPLVPQSSNNSPLVNTSATGMVSSIFQSQDFVHPNGPSYPIPSNPGVSSSTQPLGPQMVYSSTQQSSQPNMNGWNPSTLVTAFQPYTFSNINQVRPSSSEQKTSFTIPNHTEAKPSTSSELASIVNEMRAPNVVIERVMLTEQQRSLLNHASIYHQVNAINVPRTC